jgi:hypothetical protein
LRIMSGMGALAWINWLTFINIIKNWFIIY